MANQSGIAIFIKAFIPVTKDLDQQHAVLTKVKEAKTTGKFDVVLAGALDVEVKTESRTRRVEATTAS